MADKRRKAKHSTEAELDKLAEITPEDIEDAMLQWKRDASPEFKNLLDAEPEADHEPT